MKNRFTAGKFLATGGRHFRFSLARWKERRERVAVLRYFTQKPKEDGRTIIGKSLDYIGGLLLIWLAGFLVLLNLTGKPAASLAISLLLLTMQAVALKKFLEKRQKRKEIQRGLWLAGQRFMDEIKLHPQQGFAAPVKDLLGNLPGFAQLNLRHGEDKKARWNEQIDIKGLFKGAPVGVRCLYQEGEQPVTPLAVSSFFNALDDAGLKNGLFITSGDFAAGVAQVTRQATRAGIKIMLVNRYGLIDLARRAGIGVFGEEDHGLGKTKSENHRRLDAFIDTVFGSRKKVRNYFWCGLLLYGGYLLLKDTTSFSLIYLVFAVINLLLGAGSLLFSRTLGQADPLTALEPRK